MKSFKERKKLKEEKKLEERIKFEIAYNNLTKEEREYYETLAKKQKYASYLGNGFLGLMIAFAIYNGYDILGGDFFDTSLSIGQNFAYVLGSSVENIFMDIKGGCLKILSIVLPLQSFCIVNSTENSYRKEKNYLLYNDFKKNKLLDKFFEKLANRNKNIEDNKNEFETSTLNKNTANYRLNLGKEK